MAPKKSSSNVMPPSSSNGLSHVHLAVASSDEKPSIMAPLKPSPFPGLVKEAKTPTTGPGPVVKPVPATVLDPTAAPFPEPLIYTQSTAVTSAISPHLRIRPASITPPPTITTTATATATEEVGDLLTFPPQKDEFGQFSPAVTLQVGQGRFITQRMTLIQGSGYFRQLLQAPIAAPILQADGSYLLDTDPDLFTHVLQYLRRGVLPLFYDNVKGHDHARYLSLLAEARFFDIPGLVKWLEEKHFLKAVSTSYELKEVQGVPPSVTVPADVEVSYIPGWQFSEIYICPRGILGHKGSPEMCGRSCQEAARVKGSHSEYQPLSIMHTLMVKKRTMVDFDLCLRKPVKNW
ncbi:MAG: hypothetical protein M1816_004584 [Peltula sp. TS41687]|nr:MAG: hypothetical protein M1816_004584 [Peltula sp. TS41687]